MKLTMENGRLYDEHGRRVAECYWEWDVTGMVENVVVKTGPWVESDGTIVVANYDFYPPLHSEVLTLGWPLRVSTSFIHKPSVPST